jgi:uncharacterized protein YigA (DUF484 family)
MKTITVSKRAKTLQAILAQACQENLILKTTEGREFILAELNEFDRELELTRQNPELMAVLEARAKQTHTVSLEEAKLQLGFE